MHMNPSDFHNSLGDLKQNITYILGHERMEGCIEDPSPEYIATLLDVPVEEVKKILEELK